MNEKILNTFMTTVEMRSFSSCAEVLGTKQSTVSARISQLEKELGVTLFQRGKAGATLTNAGRRFEIHCKELLSLWGQATRDLDPENAVIHISIQCNMSRSCVVNWVDDLLTLQPEWSAQIDLNFSDHVFRQLHGGETDIGLVFTPVFHPELEITKLFDEKFVMYSNLVTRLKEVKVNRYVKLNFSPCFESAHREQLAELSRPKYTVGSYETGLAILRRYGGSIYLPERHAVELSELSGTGVVIDDSPIIAQPVYAVVSSRRKHDVKIKCALNSLKQQAQRHHPSEYSMNSSV